MSVVCGMTAFSRGKVFSYDSPRRSSQIASPSSKAGLATCGASHRGGRRASRVAKSASWSLPSGRMSPAPIPSGQPYASDSHYRSVSQAGQMVLWQVGKASRARTSVVQQDSTHVTRFPPRPGSIGPVPGFLSRVFKAKCRSSRYRAAFNPWRSV